MLFRVGKIELVAICWSKQDIRQQDFTAGCSNSKSIGHILEVTSLHIFTKILFYKVSFSGVFLWCDTALTLSGEKWQG